MTEAEIRASFEEQAGWCERLGSPLTAALCRALGRDLDRNTETGRRVLDWPGDPRPGADVVALRLCGGLHALVRKGAAPDLADCYPPKSLPLPATLKDVVRTHDEALLPWLDIAPQTNEVGRSAVLMSGLLALAEQVQKPMDLLELGASAGLNLILDRYAYVLGGEQRGDSSSALTLRPDWQGPPPPDARVEVAARRGVDLQPMDARRDGERLLAYVWPDQPQRLAQLETALAIAAADPPQIDAGDAADWLEQRLDEPRLPGTVRVVLHSVAFQYFPSAVQARIEAAMAEAGAAADEAEPLAWLRYEKIEGEENFSLRLKIWPDGSDRLLATAHPHGRSIHWVSTVSPLTS
ncbi:MAG: DUF2332 domain-containing protein [Alphaproteobacteria bacterium]|nr:MAG: DUF2332 domain-containing protein [Alphaproteobacteria bacterium]